MLGVIFTEFMEMVEDKMGLEMLEKVLATAKPENGGSYTTVGKYDHQEIVAMVVALSQHSGVPIPDLLKVFGHHLFGRLAERYPKFVQTDQHFFDFLEATETYIHKEVAKLYPNARFPRFETQRLSEECLEMVYHSDRSMADVAEGLITGAAEVFKQGISIDRTDQSEGKGTEVRFEIKLADG